MTATNDDLLNALNKIIALLQPTPMTTKQIVDAQANTDYMEQQDAEPTTTKL